MFCLRYQKKKSFAYILCTTILNINIIIVVFHFFFALPYRHLPRTLSAEKVKTFQKYSIIYVWAFF